MTTAPPALAAWRHLGGLLLQMQGADPLLLRRLVRAPRRAFHAYCSWLTLRGRKALAAGDAAPVARHIVQSTPKQLLAEILPAPALPLGWRLMRRLPDEALEDGQYEALVQWCQSPLAELLEKMTTIRAEDVDRVRAAAGYDPLAPLAARGMTDERTLAAFASILAVLRASGAVRDDEATRRSLLAVNSRERLSSWIARRLDGLRAPRDIAIPPGIGLRQIRTGRELRDQARRMNNCLDQLPYLQSLADLDLFFVWRAGTDQEEVLHLRQSHGGTFHAVVELRGKDNKPPADATELMRALERIGLRVLPDTFNCALDSFVSRRKS